VRPAALSELPARAAAPSEPIRVFLADDHGVTLWGLRKLIQSAAPRLALAGSASSCSELLAHRALGETDLVLLDLELADGSALECVAPLVERHGLRVVLLTGDLDTAQHREAVQRGARGVVLKSQPTALILEAIDRVHRGELWVGRALMTALVEQKLGPADDATRRIGTLTPKEVQVIQALVHQRGAKSLVLAAELGMSENTLRNHLSVIYAKLGVQRRLNLYLYALEHRIGKG
jgi:DNA-binding NarL/FixJ family response regulator